MKNKLYWKSALESIQQETPIENSELEFNKEKIFWKDAMILGKNGFKVPQELIDYEDDIIDYSDIPSIMQEDIDSGKIKWIFKAEIPIRKEINDWLAHEKIDVNKLLSELVENFYQTMKNLTKNAAI